jgi:hypothetical protein
LAVYPWLSARRTRSLPCQRPREALKCKPCEGRVCGCQLPCRSSPQRPTHERSGAEALEQHGQWV